MSGFPGERLILDVDKLIANDAFARQIIKRREQRCDLIVFYAKSGTPSATLIEAKGTRYEAFDDESKAIDQLESSYRVLRRGFDLCAIDMPEFAISGAIVTGSVTQGVLRPGLATAISAAEIEITLVPSGWDVYLEMFGR